MIIIADFETTGLIRGKVNCPGITQIGAIKYDADLNELDVFERDINPELVPGDWEEGAIKLRGVGPMDLMEADTFFAAFWDFAAFVRGSVIWSGFNINAFDTKVLSIQLERYGFTHHFPWPTHHVDLMDYVIKKFGKRRKLGDVYKELFGEKFDNAHEATADIRATAGLMRKMAMDEVQQILGRVT